MNKYDGIDEKIVMTVRKFARKLKAILSIDIDDIEQELMCRIIMNQHKFDQNKGSLLSFINGILRKTSVDLIRAQIRDKRITIFSTIPYVDELHGSFICFNGEANLMKQLPYKYRLLYQLQTDNSVTDIAKIMELPRTSITRDIELIASYIFHCNNSENNVLGLTWRKFKMKNLSIIETANVKELSELAVYDLADLSEQVAKLVSHAKELKEKLEDALNLRFSETIKENLRKENKDTGTIKFIENGFQISAEVPKKVTWDSGKISEIIKNIPEEKRKAIIKTTHVIDERKYAQLSPQDKELFADARTVTPGKTRFQISLPDEV